MSTKNSTVSLTLVLKGNAGDQLHKIGVDQLNLTKKVNDQLSFGTTATGKMVQMGAKVASTLKEQVNQSSLLTKQLDASQRQGQLLEKFMEQSATHARQMQSTVQRLGLDKTARQTREVAENVKRAQVSWSGMVGTGFQTAATVGAGITGAVLALNQPVQRTVNYQRDLYYSAATLATKQEDQAPTRKWMNEVVVKGATENGLTRDDSFLTMDALVADGVYADKNGDLAKTKQNIARAHASAAKAALASGGDAQDFAAVGLAATKRGLSELSVQGMVMQADQMGSMRARDLARVVKSQMGFMPADPANNSRSVAQLIAANEVAMDTAPDANATGTNIANLYSKMNSDDTNKRLKKDFDIDLVKRTAGDKKKGKTQLDTFLDVTQEIIGKDPKMIAIQKKLAKAGTPEEAQLVAQSQKNVIEQSGLAKIIPDMQSLLALVALTNNRKKLDQITTASIQKGEPALDSRAKDAGRFVDKAGINAGTVTAQNAEYMAMQDVTPTLSKWGKKIGEYSSSHPAETKMAGGGIVIASLLASAGGLGWLANKFTGGGASATAVAAGPPTRAKLLTRAAGRAAGTLGVATLAEDMTGWGLRALDGGKSVDAMDRKDRHKWDWVTGKYDNPLMAENDPRQQKTSIIESLFSNLSKQQEQQIAELKTLNVNIKNLPAPVVTLNGSVISEHVSEQSTTQSKRGASTNAGGSW